MGVSFDLAPKLVWAVDLHYFFWSTYDSYTFHFEVPDLALTEDLTVPTLWKDSYIARTGLEYLATDRLALRAGFAYDKSPQPASTMDTSLPDADRTTLTCRVRLQVRQADPRLRLPVRELPRTDEREARHLPGDVQDAGPPFRHRSGLQVLTTHKNLYRR